MNARQKIQPFSLFVYQFICVNLDRKVTRMTIELVRWDRSEYLVPAVWVLTISHLHLDVFRRLKRIETAFEGGDQALDPRRGKSEQAERFGANLALHQAKFAIVAETLKQRHHA